MAVIGIADGKVYCARKSGFIEIRVGQVIDGDDGVFLRDNAPHHVRPLDPEPVPEPAAPVPIVEPVVEPAAPPAGEPPADDVDFDPADHSVQQVLEHAQAHPELRDALRQAEQVGRQRTTILSTLA